MIEGVSAASRLERLEGHDNIIKWVVGSFEVSGYEGADLYEFIHDIAEHLATQEVNKGSDGTAEEIISEWSLEASETNNSGMETQVRVILAFHGVRKGIEFLQEELRDGGFFCDFPETLLCISERSAAAL